ncbi:MAG: PIN domain-containing protein [Thermoproteota archaeon]|jgi:predicted nucleic acid-binding protein|nr:PIN domain-containing protein [Thermoproteota archaeon]
MRAIIDTGLLVEIFEGSETGKKLLNLIINDKIEPMITDVTLIELTYILCRKSGIDKAKELVKKLIDSGYFTVVNSTSFSDIIAEIKCKFPISFIDAFNIGSAIGLKVNALFRKERELLNMKLNNVLFIEDI